LHPLQNSCKNLALAIKLVAYFGMEAMLEEQFVTRLLIGSLKAMETLLAEQKKHIQLLENQRDLFRAGYLEAVERCREVDPSSSPGSNDGPTAKEVAVGPDRPTSPES
jgi:hypothetical protein